MTEAQEILTRLQRIEEAISALISEKSVKEWYTTAEVAKILDRAEFTVREWCRLGRVNAAKRETGRGNAREWIISHEELQRVRNEGLMPV